MRSLTANAVPFDSGALLRCLDQIQGEALEEPPPEAIFLVNRPHDILDGANYKTGYSDLG
jgi:hypothetical protein